MSRYFLAKSVAINDLIEYNNGRKIPDYPVAIMIEISNLCNYKCIFCFHFSLVNPDRDKIRSQVDRGFIKEEHVKESLKEVLPNVLIVYPFGAGEPTIHPKFPQMIEFISSYEAMIEFDTNGMMLNEAMCSQLVRSGVHRITISFSGTDKNEYESVYIGGNFEKVLANIERLARQKQLQNTEYPIITINSIAFQHNVEKLPKFIDLMGKVGVNEIDLFPLAINSSFPELYHHCAVYNPIKHEEILMRSQHIASTYGIVLRTDAFKQLSASNEEEEKQIRIMRMGGTSIDIDVNTIKKFDITEIKKLAKTSEPENTQVKPQDSPINLAQFSIDEADDLLKISRTHPDKMPFYYCMEPFKTMLVKQSGFAEPCCLWPGSFEMGNIADQSVIDIWKGSGYESMRNSILMGKYPQNCKFCVKNNLPVQSGTEIIPEYVKWYNKRFGMRIDHEVYNYYPPQVISAKLITSSHWESTGLSKNTIPAVYGGDEYEIFKNRYCDKSIMSKITGYLEGVSKKGVWGWLWAPECPKIRFPVGLYLDGELIEETIALAFREDLLKAGIGDGSYGYLFTSAIDNVSLHNVVVRVLGTEFEQVYERDFTNFSIEWISLWKQKLIPYIKKRLFRLPIIYHLHCRTRDKYIFSRFTRKK